MSSTDGSNRRGFLGTLGTGAAGLFLTGLPGGFQWALAKQPVPDEKSGYKNHYFIFVYFRGGWDTLLCLDPRDPGYFNESTKGTTLIQPGYPLLTVKAPNDEPYIHTPIGPMGGFIGDLRKHTDHIAIIRGINMETVAHQTGYRRFLTGKVPLGTAARGNSLDAHLAAALGKNDIIPNMSMGSESYNEDLAAYANALRATNYTQLVATLSRKNTLNNLYENQIASVLAQTTNCNYDKNSLFSQNALVVRSTVDQMLAAQLQSKFDLSLNTDEMKALKAHYNYKELSTSRAAIIASQALKNGVSRCVSFPAAGNYDSHGYIDQGPNLIDTFNTLALMVEDLKSSEFPDNSGDTWLDHTTIMCFSEFARTPLVNDNGGREHWITNSALLIGGGFKGGQVIGATSDVGMMSMPTDLTTGKPSENGVILKPEHVLRTLYHLAGITSDVADLRVDPITALLKG